MRVPLDLSVYIAHIWRMKTREDLTGLRFGMLQVIRYHSTVSRHSRWVCRCDCGSERDMSSSNFKRKKNASCGCMIIPGIKLAQTTHGMSKTRPFIIWSTMISRCYNPNDKDFSRYGGRGIRACEGWRQFSNFWAEMSNGYGDDLSIERVDVNGNYEQSNCTWIPMSEQYKNRRPSSEWKAVGRPNPTGVRGVIQAPNGKWLARITLTQDGKHTSRHLGTFLTKEEAGVAFQEASNRRSITTGGCN